jgi:putative FmdB family regulatory protein
MPTYEYACRDCGEHLEVVQSFKDDALTECGRCGGALRKVFSAAGIIFKGSGYYVTDSRSAAKRDGGESKPAADAGAATGDTTSPAKPDAKPASDPGGSSTSTSTSKSA